VFVIGLAAAAGWVLGLVLLPLFVWVLLEAAVTAAEHSSAMFHRRRQAPAAVRRQPMPLTRV
jgi:hypothetical protein